MVVAGEAMLPPQLSGESPFFHPCLPVKLNRLPQGGNALAGFILGDSHSASAGWLLAEGGLQISRQREGRALVVVCSW